MTICYGTNEVFFDPGINWITIERNVINEPQPDPSVHFRVKLFGRRNYQSLHPFHEIGERSIVASFECNGVGTYRYGPYFFAG